MTTLFIEGLTNFKIYQTDEEMQSVAFEDIVPGELVYSIESNKPYYFNSNMNNMPHSSILLSKTINGYWIPYPGDYIYVDGSIINNGIQNIYLPPGKILIGNTNNYSSSYSMTGNINIDYTGLTSVSNSSVITSQFADQSVTNEKIPLNTITGSNIALNTITESNIVDERIFTASYFVSNSITGSNISDQTLGFFKLTTDCITNEKLAQSGLDGNNTTILNNYIFIGTSSNTAYYYALTGDITIDNTGTTYYADNIITNNDLVDNAITLNKLNNSITYAFILSYSITQEIEGGSTTYTLFDDNIKASDYLVINFLGATNDSYIIGVQPNDSYVVVTTNVNPGRAIFSIFGFTLIS